MRILIAEDDIDLAEALGALLERNQYTVDIANDGMAAYDYILSGVYDGVILDIMMPKMDGIQTMKMIRQQKINVPIMILTARAEKDDRVLGFDSGADDYLPKPFAPDELLARLRAMLRRRGEYQSSVLAYGNLELDCAKGLVRCGDKTERLSAKEFQILELFMRAPLCIMSTEQIIQQVWGWETEPASNVIWVHISNLRKKLKNIGSNVTIWANRGLGYILESIDD